MRHVRGENDLVDFLESNPMEAREFIEAHERWIRNPLNWTWYWFNYYRYMVLRWLGRK
jgi:hypothetical protein